MSHLSSALGDADAFREIFFEETQEHVANVEAILLRLDTDAPYPDDLNAIFRAVHSIKGSAAMLGCTEMATLTHLQENLLDLLRKGERPIASGDVDAMLRAGDTVRSQVLHQRGQLEQAPDASDVEAMLRARVALPSCDAPGGTSGPVTRNFQVRLAPLASAIDDGELEMMLAGLAEMGQVGRTSVDNRAGGAVSFEVSLQGAEADLQSVLSLVVAPEQITIETRVESQAATPEPEPEPRQQGQLDQEPAADAGVQDQDEFFVDPAQFRRRGDRARESAALAVAGAREAAPSGGIDLFVTPDSLKRERTERAAEPSDVAALMPHPETLGRAGEAFAHGSAADASSIRVATDKVDLLVNLVGELVITEAMLARQGVLGEEASNSGRYGGNTGLADLARHTRNLQEAVLAIRMQPISNVFSRFPRLVRELSARLGKRVEFVTSGEATELDRGLIEKISDPLTHLVRNAIDHGLETPEARLAAGKPPVGVISMVASQRGGKIVIEVSDDGRGLDVDRIRARAAERGLVVAPDAPDAAVWELIFEAGFSTVHEITDVSGRGVGMDVVRRNIQSLGGTVDLWSAPGQGMTVTVSVPLTLAIMEAMTVSIGSEIYVLPLASVIESRSVEADEIHALPGHGETLRVRGEYLPVLQLARLFPPRTPRAEAGGIAVIVESDGCHAAVVVDELVGQQQVVVKSLETNFRRVPGLSGATIMGDGCVALILDVGHLIRHAGEAAILA